MIATKKLVILLVASFSTLCTTTLFAGNKDRTGQAGAYELLVNPFSRSSGWGSVNFSTIKGIEATRLNVAGLAETERTELVFSKNVWLQLQGGNMGVNDLGFSQKLGKNGGVLGINVMSMTFGEIPITTTAVPDVVNGLATLGTYKPQFFNFSVCYAKKFSDAIQGGVGITGISEQIPNAKAQGATIDAGIQYHGSSSPKIKYKNIHFGISLRNVGTALQYRGDGLSALSTIQNSKYTQNLEMRSATFELPSQLNIGGAYDYKFPDEMKRISISGAFISNAFTKDLLGLGAEFSYKEQFLLHLGYRYEPGSFKKDAIRTNVYTGLSAGFTFELPVKKDGPTFGIDYSYRTTNPFHGTHSLGVRVTL
ncbi:MAG: hypothetical protein RJA07_1107 [Bacteroidota bacterium]|jgi:hypothetical protein